MSVPLEETVLEKAMGRLSCRSRRELEKLNVYQDLSLVADKDSLSRYRRLLEQAVNLPDTYHGGGWHEHVHDPVLIEDFKMDMQAELRELNHINPERNLKLLNDQVFRSVMPVLVLPGRQRGQLTLTKDVVTMIETEHEFVFEINHSFSASTRPSRPWQNHALGDGLSCRQMMRREAMAEVLIQKLSVVAVQKKAVEVIQRAYSAFLKKGEHAVYEAVLRSFKRARPSN